MSNLGNSSFPERTSTDLEGSHRLQYLMFLQSPAIDVPPLHV